MERPGPETRRVYLSGQGPDDAVQWAFVIDKGARSGEATTIAVPSNWQQQGFGHYQYGYDRGPRSDDHAVYRRSFDVPADWTGRSIRLVFDGVMTDTLVKVNGQQVGPVHQGGFNRFGFDIGTFVKPGANQLEVQVSEGSAAKDTDVAERWGDYWALSGIFRPVWIEVAPAEHITGVAIDARANGDLSIETAMTTATPPTRTPLPTANRLVAQLRDRTTGAAIGRPIEAAIPAGGTGRLRMAGHVEGVAPWSAETPNLYDLDVTMWRDAVPVHRLTTRVGFRTFEVRNGDGLYLNGQRIILKGVNRHSFRPDTGRTLSRDDAYADVRTLKSGNMNAVRMSHYSPEESFLEAADELGLYVVDELSGWQHAHDTSVGRLLVRELVERDRNHASVVLWDNGNEGGWNRALDEEFALYDPQARRVLHPWDPFGGIDTKHYPRYNDLVARLSGPALVMPTEFLHALYEGGGGAGLDDYWRAITASPKGAGGFIWNFADEGIARTDRGGAIDVAATLAPDGIVGPRGEKEPSWFTVRDVWAPVQIADPAASADPARLALTNRYDFTALDRTRVTWRLLRYPGPAEKRAEAEVLARGVATPPVVPPHASGAMTLPLPDAARARADALEVVVRLGDDEVLTRVWPLEAPRTATVTTRRAGTPVAERVGDVVRLSAGPVRAEIDAATGLLRSVGRGTAAAIVEGGPRLVYARPAAEKSEPVFTAAVAGAAGEYRPPAPQMANVIDVETGMTAEDGWGGFTMQVSADARRWTTVFQGARTARDGTRYPFAPQRVAVVRFVDLTGVRTPPVIRAVKIGYEAARFPDPATPAVTVTSGTGRDPATGRPVAWVEAPGAGGLTRVRWTIDERGTLSLDYGYTLSGPVLYHGVGFGGGAPVAKGLVRGPWPVWQNRMRGPQLGVHTLGLPGYYADPRWLRLTAPGGSLAIRNEGAARFVQVGTRIADLPSTSVDFPHAAISYLSAIPAMGAKFQPADTTGPAGLPAIAAGEYRGRLLFDPLP